MQDSTKTPQAEIDPEDLSSQVVGNQIPGARDYQEDSFQIVELSHELPDEDDQAASFQDDLDALLLVLADGMGGHVGGARASKLVVETVSDTIGAHFRNTDNDIGTLLRNSLDAANAAIAGETKKDPQYSGMGCTLVACLIVGDELHWVSVGDSPLWLLRDHKMLRLNADHSMRPVLESLLEAGEITAEDLATDFRINQLRSVVMGEDIRLVDQNAAAHLLQTNDQIILASDGLETLAVDEIRSICEQHPESAADAMLALLDEVEAKQEPGQDNATAILYRHGGGTAACAVPSGKGFLRRLFSSKGKPGTST